MIRPHHRSELDCAVYDHLIESQAGYDEHHSSLWSAGFRRCSERKMRSGAQTSDRCQSLQYCAHTVNFSRRDLPGDIHRIRIEIPASGRSRALARDQGKALKLAFPVPPIEAELVITGASPGPPPVTMLVPPP